MRALRTWSVDNARTLEGAYAILERALRGMHPLLRRIGYARLERPVASIEHAVKGLLFDCKMCGQCALSDTGMSCPMACPKQLRNGPCGGVRADGSCEVRPDMRCVWLEAWRGAESMRGGHRIQWLQPPVDLSLAGRSTWLAVARDEAWRESPGTKGMSKVHEQGP